MVLTRTFLGENAGGASEYHGGGVRSAHGDGPSVT
jgi:hypothetical protein